jgi:hypothetical protein
VKGALARFEPVGMALVEREEGAAVLQDDACVAADHRGAEVMVDRLDDGDDEAVGVGGAEVAGVTSRLPPRGVPTEAHAGLDLFGG